MARQGTTALRRGWTTGACAAAAACAAFNASRVGRFPDPVSIRLPRWREVALATLSGKTMIEVAIVDRQGGFLARVGG